MTERFVASIRELQRAGWEIRVDDEELTDFVSTTSLHEPVNRTLTIKHAKDGRVAAEFTVAHGVLYTEVIRDMVADLRAALE